jgi:hypothetical protein
MRRKTIAFILAVAMVLTAFPMGAMAERPVGHLHGQAWILGTHQILHYASRTIMIDNTLHWQGWDQNITVAGNVGGAPAGTNVADPHGVANSRRGMDLVMRFTSDVLAGEEFLIQYYNAIHAHVAPHHTLGGAQVLNRTDFSPSNPSTTGHATSANHTFNMNHFQLYSHGVLGPIMPTPNGGDYLRGLRTFGRRPGDTADGIAQGWALQHTPRETYDTQAEREDRVWGGGCCPPLKIMLTSFGKWPISGRPQVL